ncbi:unnamed protein product [Tilletia controversa]|nr:unnamed protein product [Tilletia controversa]CAD6935786.1 unnamed protein product [Tilletia controversa]CAD6942533.1 unnamed protein product [Tilletia controversa]CAD6952463.1 unnamed protein product [Tilletia laevis]CAD6968543.1 unnamed protein product [Tilletia controversa]
MAEQPERPPTAASYGSRDALRQRNAPTPVGPPTEGRFVPGATPIGFLAARKGFYGRKLTGKKTGFCCLFLAPPIIIIALIIALIPVLWAIANHALHTAQIHVYSSNLTSLSNDTFPLTLDGQIKKTGIFPAHIFFREPVQVYWNTPPPNLVEKRLGEFRLDRVGAALGHARLRQLTQFNISDEFAFGQFTEFLVTQEEFTWNLNCSNVHVKAFSFLPTFKNLQFRKHVVFKGMSNFTDVKILDFQLPGDDPAGGITLAVKTSITNPSPFGVEIGNLNLDLYYKGMYLGPASAANVNLTTGRNIIDLTGRLVPHLDNQTELDLMGELFTGYINGDTLPTVAYGRSTTQTNGETISWLSQGIKALVLQVPLKAPEPIEPIKAIAIDYLSLVYKESTPWTPEIFSKALTGQIGLPFGFSLDIVSTSNSITILYENATVGSLEGAFSNSSTKLELISAGQTAGTLDITLPQTPLVLPNNTEAAHQELVNFENAFTYGQAAGFQLNGSAKALTNTPIGQVLLNGIKFNVPTGLRGLEGLTKFPTVINSVDVTGGTKDALQLNVNTSLVNPSNLNLSVGDTTFLLFNQVLLGNVTLPDLNLAIGTNTVIGQANFDPNRDPIGVETLNRFVSGVSTQLNITGFNGSSPIASLAPVLGGLSLNASLPGLKDSLVQYANLTVLDTTGIVNNIAQTRVGLNNPFSAPLTITRIASNVSSHGIFVASINTPLDFPAAPKTVTGSPLFDLTLNLFPPDIFALVRALAIQSGQNVALIDGIVALGGYTLTQTTDANTAIRPDVNRRSLSAEESDAEVVERDSFVREEDSELASMLMDVRSNPGALPELFDERDDPSSQDLVQFAKRDNIYTGFNLPSYVDRAFEFATANIQIESDVTIGEYETKLAFSQLNVPLNTDATLNKLLPVLAQPIVQKIVDGAILGLDTITILDPQQNSFATALTGSITNAGPFDATIKFPQGLTISWEGSPLGRIAFPDINSVGDVGAQFNLTAQFQVADVGRLTDFTKVLLTEPSFVWTISGEGLTVDAIGISVSNITLTKQVQLRGFNGLQGDVIINSFDLPYDDPAGGIHLTVDATINNPSSVGVQLSRFGVSVDANGTFLGPQAAANAFTLAPMSQSPLSLVGRLVPQSGSGLDVLSALFTRVVHDQSTDLVVNGDYAGPASVTWLNDAIKVLSIPVVLPAIKFEVIKSITLKQLSLYFSEDNEWSPPASSTDTVADFFLPFGFPINIQTVQGDFIDNYLNTDIATLAIPRTDVRTDVQNRVIYLQFQNVALASPNNAHSQFSQFIADTTARDSVTFGLHGFTTAGASTAAGFVTISDIPFDVQSSLAGVQNLNARPAVVSQLDVYHGYSDFLEIRLVTTVFNPSNLTIGLGTVQFNTDFQNQVIGQAVLTDLVLVPGVNDLPTQLRYAPRGNAATAAGVQVLENYVQNVTSRVTVDGYPGSTPIDSLKQALSGIELQTDIPSLGKLLIVAAAIEFPADIGFTGLASATFTLANPFTASINLFTVKAIASYAGIVLGTIDSDISKNPVRAPGHETVTSYPLPFMFTRNLTDIVAFIIARADGAGKNIGPLVTLFPYIPQGVYTGDVTAVPLNDSVPCDSGTGPDIRGSIIDLLKGLTTDLSISTNLALDDYRTALAFTQSGVPTNTDESAVNIIGIVGPPVVQTIVDGAELSFSQANLTQLTDDGFEVSLLGSLLNTGPLDAYIEFQEPVTVTWQGRKIATIDLPAICATAGEGVPEYRATGQLKITDQKGFTDFTIAALQDPSFVWTISTNKLRVSAIGFQFNNVVLTKDVTFQAFNKLPGVTINSFDIPSQNSNSLNIVTGTTIPSPATLGIDLGTANFEIFFMGTDIGPVSSNGLVLAPMSETNATLKGEIQQQRGNDLKNLGILFSQYLAGNDSSLQIKGVSVISSAQPNSPVSWLTKAFKTLVLNVTLKGRIFTIISAITISDLEVFINGDPSDSYVVPSTNNKTVATFSNPFNFDLTPLQAGPKIIINYEGVDTARLDLPLAKLGSSDTSSGPNDSADLQLNWNKQDLVAIDRSQFGKFFAQLTDKDSATFRLDGSTDVVARTVVGDVTITDIPINVNTTLEGINSFDGTAVTDNVIVDSATGAAIFIDLDVTLQNPSALTVHTKDLSLPVFYSGLDGKGASTLVGRAVIPELDLLPGSNNVSTKFRYSPSDSNNTIAQELIQAYIQPQGGKGPPITTDVDIKGIANADPALTPYASLEPAIEGLSLKTSIKGIGSSIVTHVYVTLDLLKLFAGPNGNAIVRSKFDAINNLPVPVQIIQLDTDISSLNSPSPAAARFEAKFDNLVLPAASRAGVPNGKVTSPEFETYLLQGLLDENGRSVGLVTGPLNLANLIRARIDGAYDLEGLHYNENEVPVSYSIALGDGTVNDFGNTEDLIGGLFAAIGGLTGIEIGQIVGNLSNATIEILKDNVVLSDVDFHIIIFGLGHSYHQLGHHHNRRTVIDGVCLGVLKLDKRCARQHQCSKHDFRKLVGLIVEQWWRWIGIQNGATSVNSCNIFSMTNLLSGFQSLK